MGRYKQVPSLQSKDGETLLHTQNVARFDQELNQSRQGRISLSLLVCRGIIDKSCHNIFKRPYSVTTALLMS